MDNLMGHDLTKILKMGEDKYCLTEKITLDYLHFLIQLLNLNNSSYLLGINS